MQQVSEERARELVEQMEPGTYAVWNPDWGTEEDAEVVGPFYKAFDNHQDAATDAVQVMWDRDSADWPMAGFNVCVRSSDGIFKMFHISMDWDPSFFAREVQPS